MWYIFSKDFLFFLPEVFENSNIENKLSILNNLGSNWTIKDGKVDFIANRFLEPVKNDYKTLETEYLKLEPKNVLEKSTHSAAVEGIRLRWLERWDSDPRPSG